MCFVALIWFMAVDWGKKTALWIVKVVDPLSILCRVSEGWCSLSWDERRVTPLDESPVHRAHSNKEPCMHTLETESQLERPEYLEEIRTWRTCKLYAERPRAGFWIQNLLLGAAAVLPPAPLFPTAPPLAYQPQICNVLKTCIWVSEKI